MIEKLIAWAKEQGVELNFCGDSENLMVQANQIGKLLGTDHIRALTKNYNKTFIGYHKIHTKGGFQNVLFLSMDGVKQLISNSRKPKAVELAKALGFKIHDLKIVNFEMKTIDQITRAFKGEEANLQFRVNPYYVDLYFPRVNLAVECDERQHQQRKKEDDERESVIMKKLNCTFIRYRPYDGDFCIFDVINKIHLHILHSKN